MKQVLVVATCPEPLARGRLEDELMGGQKRCLDDLVASTERRVEFRGPNKSWCKEDLNHLFTTLKKEEKYRVIPYAMHTPNSMHVIRLINSDDTNAQRSLDSTVN
jgi:hypothetical protein